MPESFRTQRYEDRPSSKLGVGDYISKQAIALLLPFLGFGIGMALRKTTNLSWLKADYRPFSWLGKHLESKKAEEMIGLAAGYGEKGGVLGLHNGEAWFAKAGAAVGVYELWKNRRKSQIGIDDVKAKVDELRQFESGDTYLRAENQQLKSQLAFLDGKDTPSTTVKAGQAAAERLESGLEAQR